MPRIQYCWDTGGESSLKRRMPPCFAGKVGRPKRIPQSMAHLSVRQNPSFGPIMGSFCILEVLEASFGAP